MITTSFDPDIFQSVSRLEIAARNAVEGFLSGAHKSRHKGSSTEFAEHREYIPGDDIRRLDWKVYARTDKFFIREYEEETTLRVMFVVDASGSMKMSTKVSEEELRARKADANALKSVSKFRYAAGLVAGMMSVVLGAHDSAGCVIAGAKVQKATALSGSKNQLIQTCQALDAVTPEGETRVFEIAENSARTMKGKGLVIVVSDAVDEPEKIAKSLRTVRENHECVLIQVLTKEETEFPYKDLTNFTGLEADGKLSVDTAGIAKRYRALLEEHNQMLARECFGIGVDFLSVRVGESIASVIRRLIALRRGERI
ncbi:MAG: DUF58 domain-containing protein [Planctomycetes bacterium]|nr:DUF58 domain-containing protein [Planctomycetota bacterium]